MRSRQKLSSKVETPETKPDPYEVDDGFIKAHYQGIIKIITTKYVIWSPIEAAWLRMKNEAPSMPHLPLRKALSDTLKKSFAGCFIKYMNKEENTTLEITETKLGLTKFMLHEWDRPTVYSRFHDYTDDFKKYLEMAVANSNKNNGKISQKGFLGLLPVVRLCYRKITKMDVCLLKYTNLIALILTANYINDFHGKALPKTLNMLELYGNLLYDIPKLTREPPFNVLYLGIGRNYLSKAESLLRLECFQHLYFLDISENDFDDLVKVLQILSSLLSLKCLHLEGNPCSVPVSYVNIVERMCPQLEYLDGIKYQKNNLKSSEEDDYNGYLHVHGIRFFCVPEFKKGEHQNFDKIEHFYQLELELPLLDPVLQRYEARAINRIFKGMKDPEEVTPILKEINPFSGESLDITVESSKNARVSQATIAIDKERKEKIVKQKNIKRSYLKWLKKDKEIPLPASFTSTKLPWSKKMTFPDPCIKVTVPQESWRQLRDTLRSVVTMRLYYKEVGYRRRSSATSARRSGMSSKQSRRASRRASRKSTTKGARKSTTQGARKSTTKGARKSTTKGARKSTAKGARKSKAPGGRKSVARKSLKRKSKTGRRGSVKSKQKRKRSKEKEEILLVRNLIAKIPIPLEIPKWNVPFMGYTWDAREKCLSRRYPGVEDVVYRDGHSKDLSPGRRKDDKQRKSSAGKRKSVASRKSKTGSGGRKSRASGAGQRKSKTGAAPKGKSRASVAAKRKSKAPAARKSQAPGAKRKSQAPGGKRKSQAPGAKRKSQAGASGKRKSRASTAGKPTSSSDGKRRRSGSKGRKGQQVYPFPTIMTCHVGVGLKRYGKEAAARKETKAKSIATSRKSRKSKARKSTTRKSKVARKSKTGRKSMKTKTRASRVGKK